MKNKDRKNRINAMKHEIQRRGGKVMLIDSLPDEMVEMFLQQVLDCPDCDHDQGDPFRPERPNTGH